MGIRIVGQEPSAKAALYDSTTGLAFGPVFRSAGDVEDFLEWFEDQDKGRDLRTFLPSEIVEFVSEWEEYHARYESEIEIEPDLPVVAIREDGSYRYDRQPRDDFEYDLAKERGEL